MPLLPQESPANLAAAPPMLGLARVALAQAGGLTGAGLGLVSLVGWPLDYLLLVPAGSEAVPMAPSTALMLVVFGVTIFARLAGPDEGTRRSLGLTASATTLVVAATLLALSLAGIQSTIEHLGLLSGRSAGGVAVGHMSPLAAGCFVLLAASFLCVTAPRSPSPHLVGASFWIAVLVVFGASLVAVGYVFGAPLLYGTHFVPMSLAASLAFMAIGLGLVCYSAVSLDTEADSFDRTTLLGLRVPIAAFVLATAAILALGHLNVSRYHSSYRAEVGRNLGAINELKSREIANWRSNLLREARLVAGSLGTAELGRALERPADVDALARVKARLASVGTLSGFDGVALLAPGGEVIAEMPQGGLQAAATRSPTAEMAPGEFRFVDFHQHERDGPIMLDVVHAVPSAGAATPIAGYLQFAIVPDRYLLPLITAWPTYSETGETMLVRRDGQRAQVVSGSRRQSKPGVPFDVPLSESDRAPAKAVLGEEGIIDCVDFQGANTLAHVRAVPGSPWFLVSRIAVAEIKGQLGGRLWLTAGLACGALFAAAAAVFYAWRRQRTSHYRRMVEELEAAVMSTVSVATTLC